jgi:RHS repeat-associated protein
MSARVAEEVGSRSVNVFRVLSRSVGLFTAACFSALLVAGPAAGLSKTYKEIVLEDQPVGYWRLGEASGPFADSVFPGNHPGVKQNRRGTGSLFLRAQPGMSTGDSGAIASNVSGNTTTYEYDAAGNLVKTTEPGTPPVVTLFGRDPAGTGLLTSITDPRGKVTSFEYAQDNLTTVTTPLGNKTTMAYDGSGRMTSSVEPRGNVTGANPDQFRWTYSYDNADHVLTQTDPLGNVTTWTYDPVGNLKTVTDAKNRTTTYGYDGADHLTSVTAPDTTVTSYAYDPVGNLSSRTDAKQHTTTYGYDNANRLASVTTPLNGLWTYAYDANGNRTQIVDAIGNATPPPGDGQTTLSYDVLNRMTGIDHSDTTPDATFAYDGNSNRTQMSDGAGTESSVYDPLDRLESVTRGTNTFSYLYDPAGNVTRRTYPDGTVVDYAYDDDGRLASLTSDGQTTTYGYDAAGNLIRTTLPAANGYEETRSYDRAGRLTEVQNAKGPAVLSRYAYTLDPVGNPTQTTGTDGVITYKYDPLDRLTEVCYAALCPGLLDSAIRWTYDAVGNRLSEARANGTTSYSYNAGDQLTGRSGLGGVVSYSYDGNGNQTQAGSGSFSYDLANRLVSTTSGGSTTIYAYDGDGTRLQATAGASTTKYLWDESFALPQLALERDGANGLLRRYLYGANLVSATTPSATAFYHHDGLGSVVNVTSASGLPQWSYAYEPFGLPRSATRLDPLAPEQPMRFTGEYLDPTALYHLRARQFDPTVGRFLATDPLAQPLTDPYVSSYVYADDRPTVLIDPSGLASDQPNCESPLSRSCLFSWGKHKISSCVRSATCLGTQVVTSVGPGAFFRAGLAARALLQARRAAKGAGGGSQRAIGPAGDAAARGLSRVDRFRALQRDGIQVGSQRYTINDHLINSVRKSGRRHITPEDLIEALQQAPTPGLPGSRVFTNPQTGSRFFVNDADEVVGVWAGGFR